MLVADTNVMRPLIGLTGTIGSGKSTVLEIFASLGVETVSADWVVHELYKDPQIQQEINEHFKQDLFSNNQLDTQLVSEIIFTDPAEKKWLEAYIHPKVRQYLETLFTKETQEPIVAEIPLLFETGWADRFDTTILVTVSEDVRLRRLAERGQGNHRSSERANSQLPVEKKIALADHVIRNDSDLVALQDTVRALLHKLVTQ